MHGLGAVLADGLLASDAVKVEGAFEAARIAALQTEAAALHAAGAFSPARVGRAQHADRALRGDELCWITAAGHPTGREARGVGLGTELLAEFDALRIELDRALLLGARAVEAHYSMYGIGAHYARHLDRFAAPSHPQGRGEDAVAGGGRVLSLVLYLNAGWSAADGGALRLYDAAGAAHDLLPAGGDLVAFLSDRVAHEVLPATRTRWSVAAWLTRDDPASPASGHPPHSHT